MDKQRFIASSKSQLAVYAVKIGWTEGLTTDYLSGRLLLWFWGISHHLLQTERRPKPPSGREPNL